MQPSDTLFLFVSNQGEQFFLPISHWAKSDFQDYGVVEGYLFGGYFGILLFVLIFNFFIVIALKDKNVLNYLFYLVGLIFLQLSLNGFGLKWFWGDNSWIAIKSPVIFASVSIFFLLAFTRNFLSIDQHYPKTNKVLIGAKYSVGLNIIFAILASNTLLKIPILFINIITFVFGVLIIPIAYFTYKNHFKQARYFLLAFIFLILGALAFVLRNLGVINNNILSENGLQIGSALEVILLTFAIVDKFKSFRDEALTRLQEINEIKEKTNEQLEIKVKERTLELENSNQLLSSQKAIIEEKNEEITDSINYGKKIQTAILPDLEQLKLKATEAFALFKPKDIVSGDFFWVSHQHLFSFYVVADCTGHGVPGAFMSMIGNSLLNQVINEEDEIDCGKILDKLKQGVISALKQSGKEGEQKDGMDMSLIRVNHNTNKIEYAGANNSIYIISKENYKEHPEVDLEMQSEQLHLHSIKATKQPIGYQVNSHQNFKTVTVHLNKGDQIIMFTDGYPDQFGGPKGKKLKYKSFKQQLLQSSGVGSQNEYLNNFFESWIDTPNSNHEKFEQIDDVCVLGITL